MARNSSFQSYNKYYTQCQKTLSNATMVKRCTKQSSTHLGNNPWRHTNNVYVCIGI